MKKLFLLILLCSSFVSYGQVHKELAEVIAGKYMEKFSFYVDDTDTDEDGYALYLILLEEITLKKLVDASREIVDYYSDVEIAEHWTSKKISNSNVFTSAWTVTLDDTLYVIFLMYSPDHQLLAVRCNFKM